MSEPLDFNRMISLNADKDKETTLTIGVYNGAPSIAVFQGAGAPKIKINFGKPENRAILPDYLESLRTNPNPSYKVELPYTRFDMETKTRVVIATLVFARDDRNMPFIGVSAPNFTPSKFYIRPSLDFDMGARPMVEQTGLAIKGIIDHLRMDIPMAQRLTNFPKKPYGGQAGSQRPSGGGNYNRSGGGGSPAGGQDTKFDDEVVF